MSYKKASYIALGLLALLAVLYLWSTVGLRDPSTRGSIGPRYFPVILGILLLILCAISFVQTWRREDGDPVSIPNFGLVITSIVATALFLIAWLYVETFYLLVFVFTAALFSIFAPIGGWLQYTINFGLALILTLSIYGLFGLVMQVRF